MDRPLTQAEILAKKTIKQKEEFIIITNKTKNQTINIQLRAPENVPFHIGEQCIPLHPQASGKFPKSRLYQEQIQNCQKSGWLTVIQE